MSWGQVEPIFRNSSAADVVGAEVSSPGTAEGTVGSPVGLVVPLSGCEATVDEAVSAGDSFSVGDAGTSLISSVAGSPLLAAFFKRWPGRGAEPSSRSAGREKLKKTRRGTLAGVPRCGVTRRINDLCLCILLFGCCFFDRLRRHRCIPEPPCGFCTVR